MISGMLTTALAISIALVPWLADTGPQPDQVQSCLVLGPFLAAGQSGSNVDPRVIRQAFLSDSLFDCGGEAEAAPRVGAGCTLFGVVHRWREVNAQDGVVDLSSPNEKLDRSLSYIYSEIESPGASASVWAVESSGDLRIWVNGQLTHDRSASANETREDLIRVIWRPGKNRLLLKHASSGGPLVKLRALKPEEVNARLIKVAATGDTDSLRRLLDSGADANSRSSAGLTAYQVAILHGHEAAARVLAAAGGSVDDSLGSPEELTRVIASRLKGHATPSPGMAASVQSANHAKAAPWGELEIIPIVLAPSLEYIPSLLSDRRGNRWFFPQTSVKDLHKFLASAGLSESTRTQLLAITEPSPDIAGVVVTPDQKIVAGLSPSARGAIYAKLSLFPANFDQVNASHFPLELADEWLSTLRDPVRQMIRQLMYPSGNFLMFADLPLVLATTNDQEEQQRIIRVLATQRTYLVKLRIRRHSDIESMVAYWGRGGRRKDVKPLLESLARSESGQTIDIVHLLPPFARRLIYTFPFPSMKNAAAAYDCHYTSLNFFNDPPDDRFIDSATLVRVLGENYHQVYANPRLGDIVVYLTENNEIIHSAVYLASDMLFTKYGNSPAQPWIFMTSDEVKDFYPVSGKLKVRYFRPNALD